MCGYDLRNQPQKRRRLSLVDALLVLAVLAVLIFWWRVGTESSREVGEDAGVQGILPTSIPLMESTPTPLPTATPLPQPSPTPPPVTTETVLVKHIVEGGETLLSIALQYNVTVDEIQQANGLTNELIRIGDELTIPVVRESAGAGAAGQAGNFTYTVEDGDTLISIALKFGSTVEAIQQANSLAGNALIRPGDSLVIPVQGVPPEALQPTVAPTTPPVAGVPAPTPVVYAAPRLLAPPEAAEIARTEPVLLQWASVARAAAQRVVCAAAVCRAAPAPARCRRPGPRKPATGWAPSWRRPRASWPSTTGWFRSCVSILRATASWR